MKFNLSSLVARVSNVVLESLGRAERARHKRTVLYDS